MPAPAGARPGRPLQATAPQTLSQHLSRTAVPYYSLRATHLAHLRLQRALTGSAHLVSAQLALHPPALDAYHHLLPALLHPSARPGTAPYLAMHYAARAANAAYGAAFSAAVALRARVPAHALRLNHFGDREAVVVDFALRMGAVPGGLTVLAANSLANVLYGSVEAVEAVVLAVAVGGLVGRLADLLGGDLEAAIVRPVQFLEACGWTQGVVAVARPVDPLMEMPERVVRTDVLEGEERRGGRERDSLGDDALVASGGDVAAWCSPGAGMGAGGGDGGGGPRAGSASRTSRNTSSSGTSFATISSGISSGSSGSGSSGDRQGIFANYLQAHALRKFDAARLRNVPVEPAAMGAWLVSETGHSFPILAHIQQPHPRRAIAAAVRDALAPPAAMFSSRIKVLAALVFATVVSNRPMADEFAVLAASAAKKTPTPAPTIAAVRHFAAQGVPSAVLDEPGLPQFEIDVNSVVPELAVCSDLGERDLMLLIFVRSSVSAWSVDVNPDVPAVPRTVVAGMASYFTPAEIVDFVWWVSLLQCLHHLNHFYLLDIGHRNEGVGGDNAAGARSTASTSARPVPYMFTMADRARAALASEGNPASAPVTAAAVAYDDLLNAQEVGQARDAVGDIMQDGVGGLNLGIPIGGSSGGGGSFTRNRSAIGSALFGARSSRGSSSLDVLARYNAADEKPHPDTIAAMLLSHRVSFSQLKVKHYPMLKLEKLMLGAAPNTDTYLAIYPTGFRTSMLLIPNMLNIPQLLLGTGTPSSVVGVAMHYSSRASKSRYCSLHTACFAMRRGIPAAVLRTNAFSEPQAVAVDAALRLGTFPSTLTKDCRDLLYQVHSQDDVEWIVMSVAMMGFLQKFVDTTGCQLEQASYDQAGDFLTSLGWGPGKHLIQAPVDKLQELDKKKSGQFADTIWSNLSAVPFVPPVLLWDRKVTARVPSTYPAAGKWLLKRVGYHFPLLGKLRHSRCIRTLATVLRDNLDPAQCNLPPATKLMCGMVYGTIARNPVLVDDLRRCALHLGPHLLPGTCDLVIRFAEEKMDFNAPSITLSDTVLREAGADLTLGDRRALLLAKAGSTSPSTIGPVVLGGMEELFSAQAMIEQTVWLGVCQVFHRLYKFYMDETIAPQVQNTPAHAAADLEGSQSAKSAFFAVSNSSQPPSVIARDETRKSATRMSAGGGSSSEAPSMKNTTEEADKSSIVREGTGGRLILQGAEPVYFDERLGATASLDPNALKPDSPDATSGGRSVRPARGSLLFKHRNYVEEDQLTELEQVMSPELAQDVAVWEGSNDATKRTLGIDQQHPEYRSSLSGSESSSSKSQPGMAGSIPREVPELVQGHLPPRLPSLRDSGSDHHGRSIETGSIEGLAAGRRLQNLQSGSSFERSQGPLHSSPATGSYERTRAGSADAGSPARLADRPIRLTRPAPLTGSSHSPHQRGRIVSGGVFSDVSPGGRTGSEQDEGSGSS